MTKRLEKSFGVTVLEPEESTLAAPHEIITVEPGGVGGDCNVKVEVVDSLGNTADAVGVEIHEGALASPFPDPTDPELLTEKPGNLWEGSIHFDLTGGTLTNNLPTATALIWPGFEDEMGEIAWSLPKAAYFKIHTINS